MLASLSDSSLKTPALPPGDPQTKHPHPLPTPGKDVPHSISDKALIISQFLLRMNTLILSIFLLLAMIPDSCRPDGRVCFEPLHTILVTPMSVQELSSYKHLSKACIHLLHHQADRRTGIQRPPSEVCRGFSHRVCLNRYGIWFLLESAEPLPTSETHSYVPAVVSISDARITDRLTGTVTVMNIHGHD